MKPICVCISLVLFSALCKGWAAQEPVLDSTATYLLQAMQAEQQSLSAFADQASNAQTPGYQGRTLGLEQGQNGLSLQSKMADDAASVIETNEPLDLLVEGPGYFVLLSPWGEDLYTKDGRFVRDQNGVVVSKAYHYPLLTDAGPLALGFENQFKISSSGHVLLDNNSVGQIRVAQWDPDQLQALTGSLWHKKAAGQEQEQKVNYFIKTGLYAGGAVDMTKIAVNVSGVKGRFDALTTALQRKISVLTNAVDAANQ